MSALSGEKRGGVDESRFFSYGENLIYRYTLFDTLTANGRITKKNFLY
jgi:hypothetical protein